MRSGKYILALLVVFFISVKTQAQQIEKGYYMCPIRPGQANYLAGTMGELRATHFHTGIDIKTSGITGLPVFAAADGHIKRIKVSPTGYGNALYMYHPNGTFTVYAHLQEFQEEIAEYVRQYQYKKESFAVDIHLSDDRFSFKKGDVIALSGNSGSSSGPHLHFEIRDANHVVLNPLYYGFDEIKDTKAPTLSQVAFVTMDIDSRINGMFGRFEFDLVERDGNYTLESPVTLYGRIGVEVYAYDRLNGANNRNGVVKQTLLLDYKPLFSQHIDKVNFATSRNILVHANYKRMREGGRRFNKYYVDDGNFLKYYNVSNGKGQLTIVDPLEHTLGIQLEDNYGNAVQHEIKINDKGYQKNTTHKNMYALKERGYDIRQGVIEIMGNSTKEDCFARLYIRGEEKLLAHTYTADNRYFYLWDTGRGFPDSVALCDKTHVFDYKKTIPSGKSQEYSDENIALSIPSYALFDTLDLRYKRYQKEGKEFFDFQHYDQPLRKFITVKLKPNQRYNTSNSHVYSVSGNGALGFSGGEWEGNQISFKTRDLVNYTIASDSIPPQIAHLKSPAKRLKFRIKDDMSGVGDFEASLNGKWVLMNYDAKTGYLTSDPKKDIVGEFVLTVTDNAGNIKSWKRTL